MDTVVRPPAPPLTDVQPPQRRRRRWPWVVSGIVVAVLVIGGTIGGIWMANIEPIGSGSVGYGRFDVHISAPLPAPHVSQFEVNAFGVSGTVLKIPARADMRFTYLISIRNDGPVPVQIRSVGSGPIGGQTTRIAVAIKTDLGTTNGRVDRGFTPFHPFTLSPGQEAGVEMLVTVAGNPCQTKGSIMAWSWEPVTFRLFGSLGPTRHMDVPTMTEIRLVGDGHTDC